MLEFIGSLLVHPLVVVLVGGVVAAVVGQYLTELWASQRSALEGKNSLVAEISHEMAKLFSSANLAEVSRDSVPEGQTRTKLVAPIQDWTVFCDVIKSKLTAYYPSSGFDAQWETIHEAAYTFAHLAGVFPQGERQEHVDRLNRLLDLEHSRRVIDLEMFINRHSVKGDPDLETSFARSWRGTRLEIEDLRDGLFAKIITTRMRGELSGADLWKRIKDW
jgi:hypothetical protein